ncbi:hypothetical protein PV325_001290 [Microctonus aethiopoides]|nr:hypothetical protein PV325_001290 [Microctonus aethiopoides]
MRDHRLNHITVDRLESEKKNRALDQVKTGPSSGFSSSCEDHEFLEVLQIQSRIDRPTSAIGCLIDY